MKPFMNFSVGVVAGLIIADLVTEGETHRRIFNAVNACINNGRQKPIVQIASTTKPVENNDVDVIDI